MALLVRLQPHPPVNGVGSSMVEPWIVIPVVVGSSPILHPKLVSVTQWIRVLRYERRSRAFESLQRHHNGNVAPMVEQRTENSCVTGSSPVVATN